MHVQFLMGPRPQRPSGGALVVYRHARELSKRGVRVSILHARELPEWSAPQRGGVLRAALRSARRRWQNRGTRGPAWAGLPTEVEVRDVPALTARYVIRADHSIATFWPTAIALHELDGAAGKPAYLIQHYEDWAGDRDRVDATWRLPMRKLFVAEWLLQLARDKGCSQGELALVPNAIDHEVFTVETRPMRRGARVAMLYGESPWKGAAEGFAALERVKREIPELEVELFGVWNAPEALPAWMRYRRDPSRTELRALLNRSAAFLCPSWSEGWGLPGAEALAAGCALVSTDNGGVRDYARDGCEALLAPPRDAEALAGQLLRVLKDDALRQRLIAAGQRSVNGFRWERSTSALLQGLEAA
jgi:glycosyltransferase involved in cell wall biosynthesis